jgi:hypothetical protein
MFDLSFNLFLYLLGIVLLVLGINWIRLLKKCLQTKQDCDMLKNTKSFYADDES